MKLLKGRPFNPGDKKPIENEEQLVDVKFHVHKFNNRPRPTDPKQVLIITCFAEFGCESIAVMYCIPRIIQMYPGAYVIIAGWYGREYLYRHLADEYWELEEGFQWLREYSRAFNHESKNLARIERGLAQHGQVYLGQAMGGICLGNTCRVCKHFYGSSEPKNTCEKCGSDNVDWSLFANIPYYRKFAVHVPRPSIKAQKEAEKYVKPNAVGIFARNRKCYGRNLPPEFYVKLIERLEKKGFNPIWLGEKQSTLPCPVPYIEDFSRNPASRDLELTLAIISRLQFTVQFWTASTRFASMMGVPWILFESPDQIVGQGQEGMRIALTTDPNKKKLVLANYLTVLEQQDQALDLVERSVDEMYADNWQDIVGMVEQQALVEAMLRGKDFWGLYEQCS